MDLERARLRVIRKGSKLDFVPINQALRGVIQEELEERPEADSKDPLFINSHKKRYRTIRQPLATACRYAEVPRGTHHGLRHAYATMLREKGPPIESISRLLGHCNASVTQNIYVHWKDGAAAEAADTIQLGLEIRR